MVTESANLITVMHHLRTLISQIKPHSDLTFGEFCVLRMIEKENSQEDHKLTPTSLNVLLGTKKPATSRMLAVLEQKSYVERIADKKDHRIYYLELTVSGRRVLDQERKDFQALMDRISQRLGEEEIEQMTKTLLHLSQILEEEIN